MSKIDFTNPIYGRRWLSLLKSSHEYGISFQPNLSTQKSFLGFNFTSNYLGLRGPCDVNSNTVITGTSFAMGMSVDNKKNWYELSDYFSASLNVGVPTSIIEQKNRINDIFTGERKRLIFIYHPNYWLISKQFYNSRESEQDISSFMSWKTSRKFLPRLLTKWLVKSIVKRLTSELIFRKIADVEYKFDTTYSSIKLFKKDKFIKAELDAFNELSDSFDNVLIIRVPVKEQVYFQCFKDKTLKELNQNYQENWDYFRKNINVKSDVLDLMNSEVFDLADYLPFDTHWNVSGNRKFHDTLKNYYLTL